MKKMINLTPHTIIFVDSNNQFITSGHRKSRTKKSAYWHSERNYSKQNRIRSRGRASRSRIRNHLHRIRINGSSCPTSQ